MSEVRRANRGNKYPNGTRCETALKLKEQKEKREEARRRIKEGYLSYVKIEGE